MLSHLTDDDIAELAEVADDALLACLMKVTDEGATLDEVRAVETVVRVGMRLVARKWRRTGHLPTTGLALQTVFTHAAPKVTFTRPSGGLGRCELADLLLVIDDRSAAEPLHRRRAVLIQAKLHDPPHCLKLGKGNEQVQFELLSMWPHFKFQGSFYRPHYRYLTRGPVDHMWSGEYGGIDEPPLIDWTQYLVLSSAFATTPPISGAITLGRLLAGMLAGRDEHGRPAIPHGRDPWSEVVDELLDVTFNRPLRGRRPRSRRGREYPLGLMNFDAVVDGRAVPSLAAGRGEVPPMDLGEDTEWPEGAISVVRFSTGGEKVR